MSIIIPNNKEELVEFLDSNPDLSNIKLNDKYEILKICGEEHLDRLIELGFTLTDVDLETSSKYISFTILIKFFPNDLLKISKYLYGRGMIKLLKLISEDQIYANEDQLRDLFIDCIGRYKTKISTVFIQLNTKYEFVLKDNYKDGKSYINYFMSECDFREKQYILIAEYLIDNYYDRCNMSSMLSIFVCRRELNLVNKVLQFTQELDYDISDMEYPDTEIMDVLYQNIDGYNVTLYYIKCFREMSDHEIIINPVCYSNFYKHALMYLTIDEIHQKTKEEVIDDSDLE